MKYNSFMSSNNMMVSPHWLASQVGSDIMKSGGNAIEAMIASAAVISVVYPHMNSLGGDNFWIISDKALNVKAIDASGYSAKKATIEFYNDKGLKNIPSRGPLAALTVPGAVAGWEKAFEYSKTKLGGTKTLDELLEPAEFISLNGFAITNSLEKNLTLKKDELKNQNNFFHKYYKDDYNVGDILKFPEMSETFKILKKNGLRDFYDGTLFKKIISDLDKTDSPLSKNDFNNFDSLYVNPLKIKLKNSLIYNLPPPTQGLASLLILGIINQKPDIFKNESNFIHGIVEATKIAFKIRDLYLTDPKYMSFEYEKTLNKKVFQKMSNQIDFNRALRWPFKKSSGDTVWLGAIDKNRNAVSFIQSIYWEFGSGVFLPETGITMQNRGISFSLDPNHHNCLLPERKPFHTIQPALSIFDDGRIMPYGTMGGDGQPQTQAIIYSRYVNFNNNLQQSINEPRWLLGRTWGDKSTKLKLENRFDKEIYNKLKSLGHDIDLVDGFDDIMGHAGALVKNDKGLIEAGFDYRSDGAAIGN